ncbi:MAG TPA: LysM peptidoglycan-binding domain-containing protein [Thermoanaerobaculia bacterium]|nr:LysM peptidoglycan-binding domain-containing protein [Thermoanaerobaculia bacterium]
MRVRLSGIVLAATLLGGVTAPALADRPPQNLHMVDGHWTAWEPPTPAPGTQVHVIQRGDTLWDLAARFYGNPYLWPQLWEHNRYILDAHWIYPGDPLVLGPEVQPVDTLAGGAGTGELEPGEEPGEESAPVENVLTAGAAAGAPIPLGSESDLLCSGFIGDAEEEFPYTIAGSEYDVLQAGLEGNAATTLQGRWGVANTVKYGLNTSDIVYIDGGRAQGLSAGTVFTAVAPGRQVIHPTGGVFGRFYNYLGRVRVLSVQETTAIAEIIHSCDPITVGSLLRPYEPEPVPLARVTAMRPVNFPSPEEALENTPVIVFSEDEIISLGEDHVVYIDRGAEQDVTPGDIFTIYRRNRPGLPPIVLGELAVLSVQSRSAVAKIIESRYPVYIGDRLELK